MEGIVTFYNSSKQFGFIKTDGEDHYFRGSDVQGLKILRTGDKVAFASTPAGPRDKNPKAVQIVLVAMASQQRKEPRHAERTTPAAGRRPAPTRRSRGLCLLRQTDGAPHVFSQ